LSFENSNHKICPFRQCVLSDCTTYPSFEFFFSNSRHKIEEIYLEKKEEKEFKKNI
jgi:hypothetical protein